MKPPHTLPPIFLIGLLLTLRSLPTVQAATNCAAVTEIPKAPFFVLEVIEPKLVLLDNSE